MRAANLSSNLINLYILEGALVNSPNQFKTEAETAN